LLNKEDILEINIKSHSIGVEPIAARICSTFTVPAAWSGIFKITLNTHTNPNYFNGLVVQW